MNFSAFFGLPNPIYRHKGLSMFFGTSDTQAAISRKSQSGAARNAAPITMRMPDMEDGSKVHALIASCPPLDPNSLYCNLLQCSHFAETCVIAELADTPIGWVSAYRPPQQPDTLFVWQVAVAKGARGSGLAMRLIKALLARPACAGIRQIRTTITPDNRASWALFRGLARHLGSGISDTPWFLADTHFGGAHAGEHLITIGPL